MSQSTIDYTRGAKTAARRPDSTPKGVVAGLRRRLKNKKLLLNDGDFTNELKIN